MALTYAIDDAEVTEYHVDLVNQRAIVTFDEKAGNETIRKGIAYFWVTLPADPTPEDYILPLSYAQQLLNLANDASDAIKARKGIT